MEDSVHDFLIYYNNRRHSAIGIAPYWAMKNANDEILISKVKLKTEKSRQKIKRTVENYEGGQLVRILNHIQKLENIKYIVYQPLSRLYKDRKKKNCVSKAIIIKNRTNLGKISDYWATESWFLVQSKLIWKIEKEALKRVQS